MCAVSHISGAILVVTDDSTTTVAERTTLHKEADRRSTAALRQRVVLSTGNIFRQRVQVRIHSSDRHSQLQGPAFG